MRKHKRVARAWRHRTFGRRSAFYATAVATLAIFVIAGFHMSSRWALFAGVTFGMAVAGTWMLPDALLPGYIFNWQLGAWGEQNTASELKNLGDGWVVRHDVRWGARGNHDHIVAGRAVYMLNSKNVKDSRITIEGKNLRVQRLDDPDASYLADRWAPQALHEAISLKRTLDRQLGFPVAIYPVLVVWGQFTPEPTWIGEVCVLRGDKVTAWIESRPADLVDAAKREKVAQLVRSMPRA